MNMAFDLKKWHSNLFINSGATVSQTDTKTHQTYNTRNDETEDDYLNVYFYFIALASRQTAVLSSAAQHSMPAEFGRKWGTECSPEITFVYSAVCGIQREALRNLSRNKNLYIGKVLPVDLGL